MLEKLRNISPYNALSAEELESFSCHGATRKFKKNMLIINQGDETDSLYVLLDGEMKVFTEDDNGKELTVRILRPGASFGELALLGEFPRSANVMTITECSAFVVTKANYMECLRNNPQVAMALIKSLAKMVKETTDELTHIALTDVYGRLVHMLEKYAIEKDEQQLVPKFTHREMASMIGSSREMVSKILKDLEKGEYIAVTGDHYILQKKLPARW